MRRFVLNLMWLGAACSGPTAERAVIRTKLPNGTDKVQSTAAAWSQPGAGWQLIEEQRYGGGDSTSGELGEPAGYGEDAAGRLYVFDRKPSGIKVFARDGSLVRVIGREGEGPGEFRTGFVDVRDTVVVVHDPIQARTSVFDTTGKYVRSFKTFCCYWSDVLIDKAMRIVVPAWLTDDPKSLDHGGTPYVRYTLQGAAIDTLWVPGSKNRKTWTFSSPDKSGKQQMRMSVLIPWTPVVQYALNPSGGVVWGNTGAYHLVWSPNGSDSSQVADRAWTPDAIPDGMRKARFEEIVKIASRNVGEGPARQAAQLADIPSTAPAWGRLVMDEEGNVWAKQVVGSDSTQTRFDVIAANGTWLGSVTVPVAIEDWGPVRFGRGVLYAPAEDDDGRPVVVRFRVERNGKNPA